MYIYFVYNAFKAQKVCFTKSELTFKTLQKKAAAAELSKKTSEELAAQAAADAAIQAADDAEKSAAAAVYAAKKVTLGRTILVFVNCRLNVY